MTITKKLLIFFFVLAQVSTFSQKPENDLPGINNADFMVEEPEECLIQSLQQPFNLKEVELEKGINLKWKPVPVTFKCQVRGGIVGEDEISRVKEGYEVSRLFYNFSGLEPNREYRWKVRCACKTDPLTWGPFSEYKYFISPDYSLPYDPDQADDVILFPNPTSGELNLHYNKEVSEDAFMNIYTVNGIVIKTMSLKSGLNYIDTSELEKGYYILNIQSSESVEQITFIKS